MEKTVSLFTRSMHDFRKTRCLAVTALLIAMNVSLDLLGLSIKIPPNLRIGFGFLCNASIGMLFGPAVGMFSGICTDVLGYFAGNMSMGRLFPGIHPDRHGGRAHLGLLAVPEQTDPAPDHRR